MMPRSSAATTAGETPPMPTPSLPRSLADLLVRFTPCFTAPTFATFQAMVAGFLTQPGQRTVTGMLLGARLAGRRHHDLAYRFFATARSGPAGGPRGGGVGVFVPLPFLNRAVCLPILARLWLPGDPDRTPLVLARELLDLATGHLGERPVHLVGDAAYIGKPLRGLPTHVTVTARLRCDAALYELAPPRTGKPGRPRVKGTRLPELVVLAAMTRYRWVPLQVHCYAKPLEREVLALRCLWYGALKGQPVQVVLSRPLGACDGYELALVTTDLAATPAQVIERYANRWSEETAFLDARHLAGVGQARTRTRRSVERLVPFGLACLSLAIIWYARHGQPAADLAAHRARAPWYRHKRTVSVADMLAALRRAVLAAQYPHGHPDWHILDL